MFSYFFCLLIFFPIFVCYSSSLFLLFCTYRPKMNTPEYFVLCILLTAGVAAAALLKLHVRKGCAVGAAAGTNGY